MKPNASEALGAIIKVGPKNSGKLPKMKNANCNEYKLAIDCNLSNQV